MAELLIGCGSDRRKKLFIPGQEEWSDLVTLDINADHAPDVVHDLCDLPLPFERETFDEIHAYEVLEHVGAQGDYRFFFKQWEDFWRILKAGGQFYGSVPLPTSPWAWGDPSHTRVLPKECLCFLDQDAYSQVGESPMSDFRYIYKADFKQRYIKETEHHLFFILEAVKR